MNLERQELIKIYEISKKEKVTFEAVLEDYITKIEDYLSTGKKIVVDVKQNPITSPPSGVVNETKTIKGVYKGREMISEGTKKDGSKWILFKAKILTTLSDKPLTFTTFNGTPGFHELTEGDDISVEYKEETKTNKDGKEYTAKTAKSFFKEDALE